MITGHLRILKGGFFKTLSLLKSISLKYIVSGFFSHMLLSDYYWKKVGSIKSLKSFLGNCKMSFCHICHIRLYYIKIFFFSLKEFLWGQNEGYNEQDETES